MDNKQFSPELTTLLSKLNKGHSWDNQKVQALRAPERLIFTEAVDGRKRVDREEFAEMIKDKNQIQVVGVPRLKWGLEECTYRDNAVEGEVYATD